MDFRSTGNSLHQTIGRVGVAPLWIEAYGVLAEDEVHI